MAGTPHVPAEMKQRTQAKSRAALPSDPLPPAKLRLLKVLQPPSTAPPPRYQMLKHTSQWETFGIQITALGVDAETD